MRFISTLSIAIAGLSAAAYAQQPPDVVNSDSFQNTAMGTGALLYVQPFTNTGVTPPIYNGQRNTAAGALALGADTTGSWNAAFGAVALQSNTTGTNNAGFGTSALNHNTTGSLNTASGVNALWSNTTGSYNTADGIGALFYSNGDQNTGVGESALYSNTTGGLNTAIGDEVLYSNTSGANNTAAGTYALYYNVSGNNNTAAGFGALQANAAGSNNIALGYEAGYYVTGSNNIDIGSTGNAADSGDIRIGTAGTHKATYVAGIATSKITGSAVYVTAAGKLGTLASSERYKTAVAPMGAETARLLALRPVTFRLKTDETATPQYGLIAEEVEKVYPELVTRDEQGQVDGVRYDELAPILLGQVQRQQAQIAALEGEVARLAAGDGKVASLERQLAEMQALVATLAPRPTGSLGAMR